ncbi:MAG: DUF1624 domain-containing protein [Coriobacteriia bacterium]|nr:DUF1624 domain-containing protein [Coriobacteriia bacterium]
MKDVLARVREFATRLVLPPVAEGDHRRLISVDALRGLAIGGMLLVNNRASGGETPVWLLHAEWEGLRFADMVFPAFLFVAGVSLALSFGRRTTQHPVHVWLHFVLRVAALVALGVALSYFRSSDPLRIPGVLQRIGLSLLLAAPFVRFKPGWIAGLGALLLAAHSAALLWVVPPEGVDPTLRVFEALPRSIDYAVFGAEHLHHTGFDPEGLLGLVSSAGQVLLGAAAGRAIHARPRDGRTLTWLAIAGFAAFVAGWWLDATVLPIIKRVWTPSFVLVTSGGATLVLVVFYALADWLRGERVLAWLTPLGRNALAAYVGSGALALLMRSIEVTAPAGDSMTATAALSAGFVTAFGPMWGAVVYPAAHVVLWYAVTSALDRSRVYLKL